MLKYIFYQLTFKVKILVEFKMYWLSYFWISISLWSKKSIIQHEKSNVNFKDFNACYVFQNIGWTQKRKSPLFVPLSTETTRIFQNYAARGQFTNQEWHHLAEYLWFTAWHSNLLYSIWMRTFLWSWPR